MFSPESTLAASSVSQPVLLVRAILRPPSISRLTAALCLTDWFQSAQQGVYWAGTILSLLFILARLYIRHKVIGQFKADGYLVVASWALYLATTITWNILGNILYVTLDFGNSGSFYIAVTAYLKQSAHALNANLGTYYCT